MEQIIFWVGFGLVAISLLFGFLGGVRRGIKRSAMHTIFTLASIVLALLLTKTIVGAVLNIDISFITGEEGSITVNDFIMDMIPAEVLAMETLMEFVIQVPVLVLSPIVFIIFTILLYWFMSIIYLIVARAVFGKKKVDFKNNPPHRLLGGAVGAVEGFVFLVVLLSPLFGLTQTIEDIAVDAEVIEEIQSSSAHRVYTDFVLEMDEESGYEDDEEMLNFLFNEDGTMKTSKQILTPYLKNFAQIVWSVNHNPLARSCNVGNLGKNMFDTLSAVKINGEKVKLREELENMVNVYNEVANAYNSIVTLDENEPLDISSLADSLTKIIDSGLFKGVVVGILADVINNYEYTTTVREDYTYIDEFMYKIKTKMQDAEFDLYDYISGDIKTILSILKEIVESPSFKQLTEVINNALNSGAQAEVASLELEGETEESEEMTNNLAEYAFVKDLVYILDSSIPTYNSVINKVFSMNTVNDILNIFLTKAQNGDDLGGVIGEEGSIPFKLNFDIEVKDIKNTFISLGTVFDKVVSIDKKMGILDIVFAESFEISEEAKQKVIDNIGTSITSVGDIIDSVLDWKILNYTENNIEYNSIIKYLADNDIVILGDTVTTYKYLQDGTLQTTGIKTIETFKDLFTYLAPSFEALVKAGYIDIMIEIGNVEIKQPQYDMTITAMEETNVVEHENDTLNGMIPVLEMVVDMIANDHALVAKIATPLFEFDEIKVGTPIGEIFENTKADPLKIASLRDILEEALRQVVIDEDTPALTFDEIDLRPINKNSTTYSEDMQYNFKEIYKNFASFGDIIAPLNEVYEEGQNGKDDKTYLEYVVESFTDSTENKTLEVVSALVEGGLISDMATAIFANDLYNGLSNYMFNMIEEGLVDFAVGETQTTIKEGYTADHSNHKAKASYYADALAEILIVLTKMTEEQSQDEMIASMGPVLDALKDAARNGAFTSEYELIIWYMTSDVIFGSICYYTNYTVADGVIAPENDMYQKLQQYLHDYFAKQGVEEADYMAYYLSEDLNFTALVSDMQNALKFSEKLFDKLEAKLPDFESIDTDNIDKVVDVVGEVIADLLDNSNGDAAFTVDEIVDVIDTIADVADIFLEDMLGSSDYENCKDTIENYINAEEGGLADAIESVIDTDGTMSEEEKAAAIAKIQEALLGLFGIESVGGASLMAA